MIKRLHKQIVQLQEQLKVERLKSNKIEKDILLRQTTMIKCQNAKPNRRRTWAPTNSVPDIAITEVTQQQNLLAPNTSDTSNKLNTDQLFAGFGHPLEYTDEEFNSILDNSFGAILPEPTEEVPHVNRSDLLRRSLLKTPKPMLQIRRASSEDIASPTNKVNWRKRVAMLERELEEMSQFLKIEAATETDEDTIKYATIS